MTYQAKIRKWRHGAALLVLFSALTNTASAFADEAKTFRDIRMTPPRDAQAELRGALRVDAQEAADVLKISPLVEKIRAEKQRGVTDPDSLPRPLQQARLICLWKIWEAQQEVRRAAGVIDYDLSDSYTNLDTLTWKRQQTINVITALNFMQGGVLGTLKQSMGLQHDIPQQPRQEIAMTSFGTGTAMALVTLLIPGLFCRRIEEHPNSLSHVLDPSYAPPDASNSFVWQFLDSELPGTGLTRRQVLVNHWRDFAGLQITNALQVRKVGAAPDSDEKLTESIRILQLRMNILHDFKTHVEEFDGCLYELHHAITFE
jgi:hypothetical protein